MTECHVCGLSIKNTHSIYELQKCLRYSGVHQQQLANAIKKLEVLIGK